MNSPMIRRNLNALLPTVARTGGALKLAETCLLMLGLFFCGGLAAPAATIVWTNTAGGNWSTVNNWSPHQVPTPADNVVITSNGTYTVTLNVDATIASLTLGGASGTNTLSANTHNLTITNSSVVNARGVFRFNNVILAAAPGLTVNGRLNWTNVTVSGDSSVTVGVNGVMNIGGDLQLDGPLTNSGTVNWLAGNVHVAYATNNNQNGEIWNQAGGLWDIQCDQDIYNNFGGERFHNAGTLRKSAGTNTTTLTVILDNSGPVQAQSGTIALAGGSNLGGSFAANAGTAIQLSGGGFAAGTTTSFSGAGENAFIGGNLTLTDGVPPNLQFNGGNVWLAPPFQGGTITNLNLTGAYLAGTNVVSGTLGMTGGNTVSGSVTVSNGGRLNWTNVTVGVDSSVTVGVGGVMNLGGDVFLYAPLTNSGTVNWLAGIVYVTYNTNNNQNGAIWNQAGGLWDIQCDQSVNNYYGDAQFHNAGTLRKSAGTNTTTLGIYLDNSSIVQAGSGTIALTAGSNLGGHIFGGSFNAQAGAAIHLNGGNFVAGSTPNFGGAGVNALVGGNLTLTDGVPPNLQLNGGTVWLSPQFQGGTITNLNLTGAYLAGTNVVSGTLGMTGGNTVSGPVTVSNGGRLNWTNVTVGADSSVTVGVGGVMNLGGNLQLYAPLTNSGTVNWLAGIVYVTYNTNNNQNGAIWNQAGGLWDIQCDQSVNNYYGDAQFHNAGTLRKSAGTNTTYLTVNLENIGTLDAQSGFLNLSATNVFTGGTLNFGIRSTNDFGVINISGNAALAGTLSANLKSGYAINHGDTFPVLTYGSRAGTFSSFALPSQASWLTNYGSTSFTLYVVAAGSSNWPPTLPSQGNQTNNELIALVVTNTATDPGSPANPLGYALVNPPTGASIDANGIITWTPSETQGPGSYLITTVVSNSIVGYLSATNSFTVTVLEVNSPPTLTVPADQTLAASATLSVSASATDLDIPTNALKFSLLAAPSGLTINTNSGAILWTPLSGQTPSTNVVQVRVADNGTPSLSDTQSFTVIVSAPATNPTGQLTTLHFFTGADGANAYSPLLQASNGKLYGMTYSGGANNLGTIFDLTLGGVFSNLFSFSGSNGSSAFGSLAEGTDGNLYGTTQTGGVYGPQFNTTIGTLFRYTFSGQFTNLVFFTVTNGMIGGGGLIRGNNGELYGNTGAGGTNNTANAGGNPVPSGNIFRIGTNGVLTTIAYLNATNGAFPQAPLAAGSDGNLYGTASGGGVAFSGNIYSGYGSVFRTATNGGLTLLALFQGTNGSNPYNSGLVQGQDGSFYGMTRYGGTGFINGQAGSGYGTVYRITTNGTITSLFKFNGTNGSQPFGSLIQTPGGILLGTTSCGGNGFTGANSSGNGTVFQITTNGALTTLYSFSGSDGKSPYAGLTAANDGNFYGTTAAGGTNNSGTIFRISLGATVPSIIIQSITRSGSSIIFTWTATVGNNYRAQYSSALGNNNWTDLGGLINATDALMTTQDTLASSNRFYRIKLEP